MLYEALEDQTRVCVCVCRLCADRRNHFGMIIKSMTALEIRNFPQRVRVSANARCVSPTTTKNKRQINKRVQINTKSNHASLCNKLGSRKWPASHLATFWISIAAVFFFR